MNWGGTRDWKNINCNLIDIQKWHNKLIENFEYLQFNNWQFISMENTFENFIYNISQ